MTLKIISLLFGCLFTLISCSSYPMLIPAKEIKGKTITTFIGTCFEARNYDLKLSDGNTINNKGYLNWWYIGFLYNFTERLNVNYKNDLLIDGDLIGLGGILNISYLWPIPESSFFKTMTSLGTNALYEIHGNNLGFNIFQHITYFINKQLFITAIPSYFWELAEHEIEIDPSIYFDPTSNPYPIDVRTPSSWLFFNGKYSQFSCPVFITYEFKNSIQISGGLNYSHFINQSWNSESRNTSVTAKRFLLTDRLFPVIQISGQMGKIFK